MSGLRTALSLLTRIPVGTAAWPEGALARAVPWFPIVGALVGAAVAALYAGSRLVWPAPLAAVVAVGLGIALTGAFHEDGLADTADALGARDRDEALRILKDPTHGTYGVLAIVLSVALRVGALAALDGWAALALLPAAHALSRAGAGVLLWVVGPATGAGLAASYAVAVTPRGAAAGVGLALVVAVLSLGVWGLPAALVAGLGTAAVGALARRRLGGVTGDVLGAAQQVGEVAVLVLGAAAVGGGWGALAWWR